jgi:hypothetical protein
MQHALHVVSIRKVKNNTGNKMFWPMPELTKPVTEQFYCQKSININTYLFHRTLFQD